MRERTARIGLVALSLLAVLAGLDVTLRILIALGVRGLAINGPENAAGFSARTPRTTFEWTGRVGYPREFRTIARWNRWGFNDREPPQPGGEPVVAVLGDSYVEAVQVPQPAAFFRVAEVLLRAEGRALRTVGLGVSGTGACAAAESLEEFGPLLGPSTVVYAFVYNDVRDDYAPWSQAAADVEAGLPSLLSARLSTSVPALDLLRFYAREHARRWLLARGRDGVNPDSRIFRADANGDSAAAWDSTLTCVDHMATWCRTHGSAFVVLELPPGSPLYFEQACADLRSRALRCDPELPRRTLADRATKDGFVFLTPIDAFRKAWTEGAVLRFEWDGHYNSAGHRLVGEYLAAHLPEATTPQRRRDTEKETTEPRRSRRGRRGTDAPMGK